MPSDSHPSSTGLPPNVERLLADLVQSAQQCFGQNLRSVVLFGSGAEGRLRATSDVNLLVVLLRFDLAQIDAFREPLRVAHVAAKASAMFLLESELPAAAEAFAVKFDDIGRRRRVLFGEDVLARLSVSRESKKLRLRQVLMNLALRLRQQYALLSLREEQLVPAIADAAGPLRSAAATLLELEGQAVSSPKEALEQVAAYKAGLDGGELLPLVTEARQSRQLPAGKSAPLMFAFMSLVEEMLRRAERLA